VSVLLFGALFFPVPSHVEGKLHLATIQAIHFYEARAYLKALLFTL